MEKYVGTTRDKNIGSHILILDNLEIITYNIGFSRYAKHKYVI